MTSDDLAGLGFRSVGGIGELRERQRWAHLPAYSGVYAVVWSMGRSPRFLKENVGHPCATTDIRTLEEAWVPDTDMLYIGSTSRPLKRRIRELIRHGLGKMDNHSGGEWIWQLEGIEQATLLVCAAEDPVALEGELLERFSRDHRGRLPFANRRDAPVR